jgi:hypothetical protein
VVRNSFLPKWVGGAILDRSGRRGTDRLGGLPFVRTRIAGYCMAVDGCVRELMVGK